MPEPAPAGRPLPLLLGQGWSQVKPRACGHSLLWESTGKLCLAETNFETVTTLGVVGQVDCPVTIDRERRRAYRYACSDDTDADFSEIRTFDLTSKEPASAIHLGLNQWVVWLLHYLPQEGLLAGLLASHMPGEGVRIQHQLGLFDIERNKRLYVPMPRDAFMPCDLHAGRREVLFAGAEGWQIVNISGKRTGFLRMLRGLPEGRGGSLHPQKALVALGGRGIAVWNRDHGTIQQVHSCGQQPVWSPDGERLFFNESSSDLFVHHYAKNATERLFAIAGNPHTEITQSRTLALSPDGQLGALPILRRTRRALGGAGPTFSYHNSLVVLDFSKQELWQYPIAAKNLAWG